MQSGATQLRFFTPHLFASKPLRNLFLLPLRGIPSLRCNLRVSLHHAPRACEVGRRTVRRASWLHGRRTSANHTCLHPNMKTPRQLLPALAFALAPFISVFAAEIDGRWRAEFDSQIGQQKYVFELKADGEKLTGKAFAERQGQKSETEIKNGKIVKDEVSFAESLKFQDREIVIEYKGKLAGGELKLHRKVGDLAAYDIVAKRENPAAK